MKSRIPLIAALLAPAFAAAGTTETDICVYGGTAAGVTAAVQAARSGKSVVLVEPRKHLGGMTSGGLGATDIGNKDVIGGLSREFYRNVARHYADDSVWKWETREHYFDGRSKRTTLEEVTGPDATMWKVATWCPSATVRSETSRARSRSVRPENCASANATATRSTAWAAPRSMAISVSSFTIRSVLITDVASTNAFSGRACCSWSRNTAHV